MKHRVTTTRLRRFAIARIWRILFAFTASAALTSACMPGLPAYAEDAPTADANTTSNTSDAGNADNTDAEATHMLRIDKTTSTITDTSGYHISVTVSNITSETITNATLTVSTNASYVFVSRTDIQQWAEGTARIPTPGLLGQSTIASLAPGQSTTVAIDVDAGAQIMQSFSAWGPKPVLVSLEGDASHIDDIHTFATRSPAGLNTTQTPAMNITMAMPITGDSWSVDDTAIADQITGGDATDVFSSSKDAVTRHKALEQTIAKHDDLQIVGDPTYLTTLTMPTQTDGIMQPADFDITAYSAYGNTAAFADAGISKQEWNADAAIDDLHDALGDNTAQSNVYAWQGDANWTLDALNVAASQGYSTVIATHDFDANDSATVETGKYVVPTDSGDVTVLAAQNVLTALAQSQPTSSQADGESTDAGRLARFVAQSAFYQMEQPYTSRNLLVCLSQDADPAFVDSLMQTIEQSSWLNLTDMNTLAAADAYMSGADAMQAIPAESGLGEQCKTFISDVLQQAQHADDTIERFRDVIIDDESTTSKSDDNNAQTDGTNDVDHWVAQLSGTATNLAMAALEADDESRTALLEALRAITDDLNTTVHITPSETVSVVSETANMPVTVRNDLPFAVDIQVSSITDSAQIVTSRFEDIHIPANSESQVTFNIRVLTSGQAMATTTLVDRNGDVFGTSQATTITSALQISDKSGFVIIAFAVLLGILGLWRQFNRKKDPDE